MSKRWLTTRKSQKTRWNENWRVIWRKKKRNSVAIEREFDNCGPSKSRATDDRPDESHERGRKNAQCTCLYLFCIISSALPKVSSARQVLLASLSFFFPFSSQFIFSFCVPSHFAELIDARCQTLPSALRKDLSKCQFSKNVKRNLHSWI